MPAESSRVRCLQTRHPDLRAQMDEAAARSADHGVVSIGFGAPHGTVLS